MFVVDPGLVQVDELTARAIPEHFARRYKVCPLALHTPSNRLMLGMEDPQNAMALGDVAIVTGYQVCPVRLSGEGGLTPTWWQFENALLFPRLSEHQRESDVVFPVTRMAVSAHVTGNLASIQLEQTFCNPFQEYMQAIFSFPLSAGASIHRLWLRVGSRILEGQIQGHLEGAPESHLRRRKEDVSGPLFTMEIDHIAPGEEVVVELSYAENLPGSGSQTRLCLPLPPRLSPPAQLKVRVELETSAVPAAYLGCSQPVLAERTCEGNLRLSVAEENLVDGDFLLHFDLAGEQTRAALLSDGEHFLLSIWPPQETKAWPRDIAFLIDHSGSMGGDKIAATRRAVLEFIAGLEPHDRFSLLAFDNQIQHFDSGEWNSPDRLEQAAHWLEEQAAAPQAPFLHPAAPQAPFLHPPAPQGGPLGWLGGQKGIEGRLLCGVLITDGEIGNEAQIVQEIAASSSSARIFTVGIGGGVNSNFLRLISHLGRGNCQLVSSADRLPGALTLLSREIALPQLTDVRLTDGGKVMDSSGPIPDLFRARPLAVLGKNGSAERDQVIVVQGVTSDKRVWSLPLESTRSTNPALGILWARQQLCLLEDRLALSQPRQAAELLSQIRLIALNYGLLTPYTTMVLIDHSQGGDGGGRGGSEAVGLAEAPNASAQDSGIARLIQRAFTAPLKNSVAPQPPLPSSQEDASIVRVVHLILSRAIQDGASHVHIEPEAKSLRVRFRIGGGLQDVMGPPKSIQGPLSVRLKLLAGLQVAERRLPQTGRVELRHQGRAFQLEVSTCPTLHGERIVIALLEISRALPPLASFGPAACRLPALLERQRGLILVAGPRGSGRTTLIATLLSQLAPQRMAAHCDPGCPALPGVSSLALVGQFGLLDALLALDRQDADVVGVPECWGQEELGQLIRMGSDRRLVLASWQGEQLWEVLQGLSHRAPDPSLLSTSLAAIVVLRSFPKLCRRCHLPDASPDLLMLLGDRNWRTAGGCVHCHMTGLSGRMWASEILEMRADFWTRQTPGSRLRAALGNQFTIISQALQLAEAGLIDARALARWLHCT